MPGPRALRAPARLVQNRRDVPQRDGEAKVLPAALEHHGVRLPPVGEQTVHGALRQGHAHAGQHNGDRRAEDGVASQNYDETDADNRAEQQRGDRAPPFARARASKLHW